MIIDFFCYFGFISCVFFYFLFFDFFLILPFLWAVWGWGDQKKGCISFSRGGEREVVEIKM